MNWKQTMIEEERRLLMQEKRQGSDLPRSKKMTSLVGAINSKEQSFGSGESTAFEWPRSSQSQKSEASV